MELSAAPDGAMPDTVDGEGTSLIEHQRWLLAASAPEGVLTEADVSPLRAAAATQMPEEGDDENPALPADFRLQVKLLKGLHSQDRVLHTLVENQQKVEADLETIRTSMMREFGRIVDCMDSHFSSLNGPTPGLSSVRSAIAIEQSGGGAVNGHQQLACVNGHLLHPSSAMEYGAAKGKWSRIAGWCRCVGPSEAESAETARGNWQ